MADYEGIDTADYDTETNEENSGAVSLQKRNVWDMAETARQPTTNVISGGSLVPVFRGFLGGEYVFNTGSPPVGASDIVVVALVAQ